MKLMQFALLIGRTDLLSTFTTYVRYTNITILNNLVLFSKAKRHSMHFFLLL